MRQNRTARPPFGSNRSLLILLAALHAVVDFMCIAGVLWAASRLGKDTFAAFGFIVRYNLLAFSGQVILGLLVDKLRQPRGVVIAGCALVAISWALFPQLPELGLLFAGVGNALFHLGAGTICLAMAPGRAEPVGLFVAPGAFGVLFGTLLAKSGDYPIWLPLILTSALLIFFLPLPSTDPQREKASERLGLESLAVFLLLVAIAIRSYVGMHLAYPWTKDLVLLFLLTTGIVLGKACGGSIADRLGWERLTAGALLGATIFLAQRPEFVWAGILGMFLFNLVMPVTLAAVVSLIPGRPAFGFGLTCLALNLGTLPLPAGLAATEGFKWLFPALSLFAGILILVALWLRQQARSSQFLTMPLEDARTA